MTLFQSIQMAIQKGIIFTLSMIPPLHKILGLAFFCLICLNGMPGYSCAQPSPPPKRLEEVLQKTFPGYRFPMAKDRTRGWAKESTACSEPYACAGDFNGDGSPDYVSFIVNQRKWKLVVFLSQADQQMSAVELTFPGSQTHLHRTYKPQDFVLSVLKKGEKVAPGGKPREDSLHPLDSIVLSFSSKSDGCLVFRLYPGGKRFSKISYDGFLSDD